MLYYSAGSWLKKLCAVHLSNETKINWNYAKLIVAMCLLIRPALRASFFHEYLDGNSQLTDTVFFDSVLFVWKTREKSGLKLIFQKAACIMTDEG